LAGSVVRVSAADARPVRQDVLRPGQPVGAVIYHGDDDPDTLHAAVRRRRVVVAVATVLAEPRPDTTEVGAWHLRGMAVRPVYQRHGYGSALVDACLAHVSAHQGSLVWCNARVGALDFYVRHGFRAVGECFYLPGAGDHYRMVRELS